MPQLAGASSPEKVVPLGDMFFRVKTLRSMRGRYDGDGSTNFQGFVDGTDPANSGSALRIGAVTTTSSDVAISFASVPGKIYRFEMRDSLTSGAWAPLVDQFVGTGGPMTITDPGSAALLMRFYRAVILP